MGIFNEGREFDPALRRRIAAFIDAWFEDPNVDQDDAFIAYEEAPAEPLFSAPAAASAYSEEAAEPMYSDAAMSAPSKSEPVAPMFAAPAMSAPAPSTPRTSRERKKGTIGKALESLGVTRKREAIDLDIPDGEAARFSAAPSYCDKGAEGLGLWLDQVDEPFSTTLLALIDRKGLTDVDVYKRAHMSRQLFSRIRGDASYRPAKKTVLALAIAMELSLDETRDLLERAGFALSRSSKRDLIVEYFVTHGMYDLFAVNEALYEFDQPLI